MSRFDRNPPRRWARWAVGLIVVAVLVLLTAQVVYALWPKGTVRHFYSNSSHTNLVGEAWVDCAGNPGSWGQQTGFYETDWGDGCVGEP